MKKRSGFNDLLEQSLYEKRGVPLCVSANIDLFKELMGDFKQYEKLNKVISKELLTQMSDF